MLLEDFESLVAGSGDLDFVAARAQEFAERETNGLLVVDNQNARHFLLSLYRGSRIVNVVPISGVLSTVIAPL